ncbi:MAG: SHOCT-like domain-containing protein [Chloroflexota bacterium]
MAENERLHILEMLDRGQITAEQALALIQALDAGAAGESLPAGVPFPPVSPEAESDPDAQPSSPLPDAEAPAPAVEVFAPEPEDAPEAPAAGQVYTPSGRFRSFWLIPLWMGAAITVLGGLLMYLAWQASGFGFWFACAWFPFALGVLALIFAWLARGMPWLHLRVRRSQGEGPHNIVISFPLPLRLAGWGLRTFGQRIPGMERTNVDEIIVALEHISPETPFCVEVDEGDGEHVEIYIG